MKFKTKEILFFIGFFILTLSKYISNIALLKSINNHRLIVDAIGIFLIIVYLAQRRNFSWKVVILLSIGVINFLMVRDSTLLTFVTILLALKNITVDKIIQYYYKINAFILTICTLMYPVLLKINLVSTSFISGRERYTFLFNHPNTYSITFVFVFLAYIYLDKEKISNIRIIITCIFAIIYLYIFPKTITAVISLLVFLTLFVFTQYFKYIRKYVLKFALPIFTILCITTIYSFYYNLDIPIIRNYISGTFEIRFVDAAYALKYYKLSLFGTLINDLGSLVYRDGNWVSHWLDLGYIRALFNYGILGFVLYLICLTRAFYNYIKNKQYFIVILITVVIIYGLSEWGAFDIITAFPLLFLYIGLLSKKKLMKCNSRGNI